MTPDLVFRMHSLLKKEILNATLTVSCGSASNAGDWRCRRGERIACSSDLGYAAIDEDLAGRDETAVVGGEEGDDLRDLLDGFPFGQGVLCLPRVP